MDRQLLSYNACILNYILGQLSQFMCISRFWVETGVGHTSRNSEIRHGASFGPAPNFVLYKPVLDPVSAIYVLTKDRHVQEFCTCGTRGVPVSKGNRQWSRGRRDRRVLLHHKRIVWVPTWNLGGLCFVHRARGPLRLVMIKVPDHQNKTAY